MAGWHGANADSFQIALFLPGPAELVHITLHTGKDQRHLRPGATKPLTDSEENDRVPYLFRVFVP